jgi:hypothetical protein
MQLVLGHPLTNEGSEMPVDRASVFEHYQALFNNATDCMVEDTPSYSECLAHMAVTMSVANKNMVSETFEGRAEAYLAFRMRRELRSEITWQ